MKINKTNSDTKRDIKQTQFFRKTLFVKIFIVKFLLVSSRKFFQLQQILILRARLSWENKSAD